MMRFNNLLERLLLVLCCFVFSASLLSAQNKTVKGVVLDETDQGVIGAAVMVKGTTTGVATDVDGNFELGCKPGDVLVITSIGYKDVEVTVDDRTSYTIRMELDNQILDDVVVIGYGTTRAKNFTGSVDVMKTGEDAPVANLGLNNVACPAWSWALNPPPWAAMPASACAAAVPSARPALPRCLW